MSIHIFIIRMEQLIHFHHNKCLFKCDKNDFDRNMKFVLTKLFSYESICNASIFYSRDRVTKCMICLQLISTVEMHCITSPFLICDECCDICVDVSTFIEFYPCMDDIHSYWFSYNDRTREYVVSSFKYAIGSNAFINNSHK